MKETLIIFFGFLLIYFLGIQQLGWIGSLIAAIFTILFICAIGGLAWLLTKIYEICRKNKRVE
jgi:hypothetical protein